MSLVVISPHKEKKKAGDSRLWSGIGVKIKVAFHCTDLAFYAVLFEFNVASVAFSRSVAN